MFVSGVPDCPVITRIRDTIGSIWHTKASTAQKAIDRLNIGFQHATALGLDVDMQATQKAKALLGKRPKPCLENSGMNQRISKADVKLTPHDVHSGPIVLKTPFFEQITKNLCHTA